MSLTSETRTTESGDNAPPLDPSGWTSLTAGLLVILITFSPPTAMSISSESCSLRSISRSEFLSSLPPWRRLLARLNWHPTVDAQIREQEWKRRALESERRTKLIENDIERLAVLESKLDSLLLSADSFSQTPPETDCS
jgi:hypothetical protein